MAVRVRPKGVQSKATGAKVSVTDDQDKYQLELKFKRKHRELIAQAKNNATFQSWNAQNDQKFGFIPLTDCEIPSKNNFCQGPVDTISQHEIVSKSGVPNFKGAQILVNTKLCLLAWERYLNKYWGKQLLFLLKGGER